MWLSRTSRRIEPRKRVLRFTALKLFTCYLINKNSIYFGFSNENEFFNIEAQHFDLSSDRPPVRMTLAAGHSAIIPVSRGVGEPALSVTFDGRGDQVSTTDFKTVVGSIR